MDVLSDLPILEGPVVRDADPAEQAAHEQAQQPPPGTPAPPKPLALVTEDEQRLVAYACGKCGTVFPVWKDGDRLQAVEFAAACCAPVPCLGGCGMLLSPKGLRRCAPCREQYDAERERAAYEKAAKLTPAQYGDGMVYRKGYGDDGYAPDLDSLLGQAEHAGIPRPAYVWACKPRPFKLDAQDIVDAGLQDHHDDAAEGISDRAMERLQEFLDLWCKEQDITTWDPDYSRVILVPAEAEG